MAGKKRKTDGSGSASVVRQRVAAVAATPQSIGSSSGSPAAAKAKAPSKKTRRKRLSEAEIQEAEQKELQKELSLLYRRYDMTPQSFWPFPQIVHMHMGIVNTVQESYLRGYALLPNADGTREEVRMQIKDADEIHECAQDYVGGDPYQPIVAGMWKIRYMPQPQDEPALERWELVLPMNLKKPHHVNVFMEAVHVATRHPRWGPSMVMEYQSLCDHVYGPETAAEPLDDAYDPAEVPNNAALAAAAASF
jgi:hypothetical protein